MINCIKITLATPAVRVLIQRPRAIIPGGIYIRHTCRGSVEDSGPPPPAEVAFVWKCHKHIPNRGAQGLPEKLVLTESAAAPSRTVSAGKDCGAERRARAPANSSRSPLFPTQGWGVTFRFINAQMQRHRGKKWNQQSRGITLLWLLQ